jgi:ADP-heptose:LPS heptosyltransferase
MERFANQLLRDLPHLAVFSSSKVGNFVVITPLLRGLKARYPGCTLDFFGSDITQDFEEHCPYIDWRFSLYSDRPDFLETLVQELAQRREQAGVYDLAINCDEFSEINLVMVTALRPTYLAGAGLTLDFGRKLPHQGTALLQDQDWNSVAFRERYRDWLTSNYIAEIFCRVAYVDTDFLKLEVHTQPPPFPVPDILIHVTASRSAKQWSAPYWLKVIHWCEQQNLSIGLIGSPSELQHHLYHSQQLEDTLLSQSHLIDLRGKTPLTQLAGALQQAKACVTIDSGPLHIATAVGCPTVAIFGNNVEGNGASPFRLWAPQQPHVKFALSQFNCTLCEENRFKNADCLLETHVCMDQLLPETVIAELQVLLETNAPHLTPHDV